MSSRILALALTLALGIAGLAIPAASPALAEGAQVEATEAQWKAWISERIKQSWVEMYAKEKGLDPATVTFDQLPDDLKARYKKAFKDILAQN